MRTITLEEHFVTDAFVRATGAYGEDTPQLREVLPKLLDIGEGRIANLDSNGIDLQILSLAALGLDSLDAETATSLLRDVNDELAAAVRAHPDRLAGFANLALQEPEKAAAEFERCVTRFGFKGAMINGTADGRFLDDARFVPVLETAVQLGVPIYLHPAAPPPAVKEAYYSGLPGEMGQLLSIAGWGWHAETALHTLRLIVSGVFDRLPALQVVIGHMGENLPFSLARSSGMLSRASHLQQPVADYFKSNIHITTSGFFTEPPFRCALEVVGFERMLFSIDYPFSPNEAGRKYLSLLEGVLSEEQLVALTHGNVERLFKL